MVRSVAACRTFDAAALLMPRASLQVPIDRVDPVFRKTDPFDLRCLRVSGTARQQQRNDREDDCHEVPPFRSRLTQDLKLMGLHRLAANGFAGAPVNAADSAAISGRGAGHIRRFHARPFACVIDELKATMSRWFATHN